MHAFENPSFCKERTNGRTNARSIERVSDGAVDRAFARSRVRSSRCAIAGSSERPRARSIVVVLVPAIVPALALFVVPFLHRSRRLRHRRLRRGRSALVRRCSRRVGCCDIFRGRLRRGRRIVVRGRQHGGAPEDDADDDHCGDQSFQHRTRKNARRGTCCGAAVDEPSSQDAEEPAAVLGLCWRGLWGGLDGLRVGDEGSLWRGFCRRRDGLGVDRGRLLRRGVGRWFCLHGIIVLRRARRQGRFPRRR